MKRKRAALPALARSPRATPTVTVRPAIAEQLHVYQSGRRCLRGHSGLRYKSTGACVHCQRARALAVHRANVIAERERRIEAFNGDYSA